MTPAHVSAPLTVEQLLEGIKHLSPASLREFQRRFRAWEGQNGRSDGDAREFRQASQDRLSANEERRLKQLIARSERGILTPAELAEYRGLAWRSEQVSAVRIQELAELAGSSGQATPTLARKSGKKGSARGT